MASLQARTLVWKIIKILFYPFLFILGPVRTYGLSESKKKAPYVVICNHPSLFDPILLFLFAPRPMVFLGAAEIFDLPIIKSLAYFFNAIPILRGNPSSAKKALYQAIDELNREEIVALFPEGQTSSQLDLRKLNRGFLFIAKKANVPVQCVIVKNTSRVIPYGKYIPRPSFKLLKVFWGKQFLWSDYESEELFLEAIQTHYQHILNEKT